MHMITAVLHGTNITFDRDEHGGPTVRIYFPG